MVLVCGTNAPFYKIPAFERIYDALDTYKRKSDMMKLSHNDLKNGDIVMAEFLVTRWVPKDESDEVVPIAGPSFKKGRAGSKSQSQKSGRREWKSWNVEFRLDAISLIYPGSDYHEDRVKPDEDVEL